MFDLFSLISFSDLSSLLSPRFPLLTSCFSRGGNVRNFEKDAPALSVVLQHVARRGCPVALVLAPFEIATHIRLKGKDLDWLAARREQLGRGAAGWLAKMARPWLRFWGEITPAPALQCALCVRALRSMQCEIAPAPAL